MNKSNDCKEDDDRRRDGVMIAADLHLVASVNINVSICFVEQRVDSTMGYDLDSTRVT